MHGGRKRLFGRGSCRKRFIPQAILYHGRQQIRGKELLMADLALRFGKDMLVVSSPIQEALRRAGIESVCDQALAQLGKKTLLLDCDIGLRFAAGSRLQGVACGKSRPVRPRSAAVLRLHLRRLLLEWVHDGR